MVHVAPSNAELEQSLLRLNRRAAVLHAALAIGVLVITIAKWDTTFNLRLTKRAYRIDAFSQCQTQCYKDDKARFDRLSADDRLIRTEQLYQGQRTVFKAPVGACVALFAAITALFHFLLAYPLRDRYVHWVFAEQRQPARWIEYSITASIMTCVVASLCGIQDINVQLGLFMMTAATMLTGAAIERVPSAADGLSAEQWAWYAAGCGLFVATWAIILESYVAIKRFLERDGRDLIDLLRDLIKFPKEVEKDPQIPDFVTWTTVNIVILFALFAVVALIAQNINNWVNYRYTGEYGPSNPKEFAYATGERQFVMLSFISKAFLVIMIGSAMLRDDPATYLQ